MKLLILISFITMCRAIGRSQAVQVKGKLICNDNPEANVRVKLYEKGVAFDNKMDDQTSDSNGEFHLKGTETEISAIDPRVNIYHDCDDGWTNLIQPCQRRLTFHVPDSYIASGDSAHKVYDMGIIQLAGKWAGETRDCIHRQ